MQSKVKRTNRNLAEHLKLMRKDRKISMRQLSEELGTTQSTVGKIELNTRRLDICEFIYYCRALGKDPVKELRIIAAY